MGRFNFADGEPVTVRAKRTARSIYRSTASVTTYGQTPGTPATGDAWLGRVEVIGPPSGMTALTSATAGTRARVTIRNDDNLTVDMLDHDGDVSDMNIVCVGTVGGTPGTEDTLITTVIPLSETHGMNRGLHPALHISGGDPVYYPSLDHRMVYVSVDGFTQTEITNREAWGYNGPNLANQTAVAQASAGKGYNPGGVYKYGETVELAVDASVARNLVRNGLGATGATRFQTVEIALRKGDDFTGNNAIGKELFVGRGPLHPSIVRYYGASEDPAVSATARPIVGGIMTGAVNAASANWIVSGIRATGDQIVYTSPYLAVQNVWCEGGDISIRSSGGVAYGTTVENYVGANNWASYDQAATGTWKEKNTHKTGIYVSGGHSTLIKDSWLFHCGWQAGYDFDIALNQPDPPEKWSQGLYLAAGGFNVPEGEERNTNSKDITVSGVMSTEAGANDMQTRPGAVSIGCFFGRGNKGCLYGGGPDLSAVQSDGNYTYAWSTVRSGQGYKTTSTGNSDTPGDAIIIGGWDSTFDEYIVANVGDLHPSNIAHTQYNANSTAFKIKINDFGSTVTPRHYEGVVHNWGNSSPLNPNSASTADLDDISVTAWLDDELATTGSTWEDFNDHCEAHANPWEVGAAFVSWARDKAGYDETARTAADTFTFQPPDTMPTPGCRWDIPRDWSPATFTGKMLDWRPGMVSGYNDNVDLDGHRVYNYLSLADDLNNFDFGSNGHLIQTGGHLCITGTISGSGTLETVMRGIVKLDGSAHDLASIIPIVGGRLENHGTITGQTDYSVYGYGEFLIGVEGSSFTLPSGASLTIDGYWARAGWDGATGTATADFQAGSTVYFKPGIKLDFSGFDTTVGPFVPGTTITGATSGATGVIDDFWCWDDTSKTQGTMFLREVTGTFTDTENLTGSRYDTFDVLTGETLCQVAATTVGCPYVKKEIFGGFGNTAPALTVNLTINGAIEIDVTNLGTGTYALFDDCDSVSGTPSGYTVTGLGGSRDATLNIESDRIDLVLASGTGVTNAIVDNR